jgi:hypothetical protein
MRPSAGNAVTSDLLIWAVLPPERRAAAVALLAMLAARAAARVAGGGRDEPGQLPAAGAAAAEDPPGAPGPGSGGVPVSQSTLVQVREHTESTMRQYALADTAVRLGWAPRDVEVIDRDLGLSGTSAAHREGFRELMSRVCLGEVGAVLGLEVSRLARSNADLARLAEMARLTGTLLIDSDGVYDLSDFNDRLLLGLSAPA